MDSCSQDSDCGDGERCITSGDLARPSCMDGTYIVICNHIHILNCSLCYISGCVCSCSDHISIVLLIAKSVRLLPFVNIFSAKCVSMKLLAS